MLCLRFLRGNGLPTAPLVHVHVGIPKEQQYGVPRGNDIYAMHHCDIWRSEIDRLHFRILLICFWLFDQHQLLRFIAHDASVVRVYETRRENPGKRRCIARVHGFDPLGLRVQHGDRLGVGASAGAGRQRQRHAECQKQSLHDAWFALRPAHLWRSSPPGREQPRTTMGTPKSSKLRWLRIRNGAWVMCYSEGCTRFTRTYCKRSDCRTPQCDQCKGDHMLRSHTVPKLARNTGTIRLKGFESLDAARQIEILALVAKIRRRREVEQCDIGIVKPGTFVAWALVHGELVEKHNERVEQALQDLYVDLQERAAAKRLSRA